MFNIFNFKKKSKKDKLKYKSKITILNKEKKEISITVECEDMHLTAEVSNLIKIGFRNNVFNKLKLEEIKVQQEFKKMDESFSSMNDIMDELKSMKSTYR